MLFTLPCADQSGSSFFVTIPAEIRCEIYLYLLHQSNIIFLPLCTRDPDSGSTTCRRHCDSCPFPLRTRLLQVCQRCYIESWPYVYDSNTYSLKAGVRAFRCMVGPDGPDGRDAHGQRPAVVKITGPRTALNGHGQPLLYPLAIWERLKQLQLNVEITTAIGSTPPQESHLAQFAMLSDFVATRCKALQYIRIRLVEDDNYSAHGWTRRRRSDAGAGAGAGTSGGGGDGNDVDQDRPFGRAVDDMLAYARPLVFSLQRIRCKKLTVRVTSEVCRRVPELSLLQSHLKPLTRETIEIVQNDAPVDDRQCEGMI